MKRELGLREERVREFGFFEETGQEEEEPRELEGEEGEDQFGAAAARTRCGRLSRPPHQLRSEGVGELEEAQDIPPPPPPPVLEVAPEVLPAPRPGRRNFTPPARFVCKVCGKLYLGDRKIQRHLKNFPSHGFATPEPPAGPPVPGLARRQGQPLDAGIQELEPGALLDLAGPRLFQAFSMWELLVRKTSSRGLGTVEALMSVLGDMQALVMELKNLVEQCLATERTNQDSFSLTLSPVMSSVLGLSHSGGVTRYVLPYNQVPAHYHKLLGFPTGLQVRTPAHWVLHYLVQASMSSPTATAGLLSPSSTTSLLHPEEENSQMSLSSDCPDLPLGDKVPSLLLATPFCPSPGGSRGQPGLPCTPRHGRVHPGLRTYSTLAPAP